MIDVRATDRDVVEIYTLEDTAVEQHGPSDSSEWFEESFSTDCIVPRSEEWDLLGAWRLRPFCPRCGATSRAWLWGLVAGNWDDDDDVVLGGCMVEQEPPSYQCSECAHDF